VVPSLRCWPRKPTMTRFSWLSGSILAAGRDRLQLQPGHGHGARGTGHGLGARASSMGTGSGIAGTKKLTVLFGFRARRTSARTPWAVEGGPRTVTLPATGRCYLEGEAMCVLTLGSINAPVPGHGGPTSRTVPGRSTWICATSELLPAANVSSRAFPPLVPRRSGFDGLPWRSRIRGLSRHPRGVAAKGPRRASFRKRTHVRARENDKPHRARRVGFRAARGTV